MTPVLVGQLLGVSFACGLNLYATVAALGLFSRLGFIQDLPPALRGLESSIIIGTALVLYLVEAIIDRVHHADSVWDAVHTIIRPTAAAFFAIGMLWAQPPAIQAGGAVFAFLVALAAHGTKAGLRVALNATNRNGSAARISTLEDLVAVAFVFAALEYPATALAVGALVLGILAVFGPGLWRAFALGLRAVGAWFQGLFTTPGWREAGQIPTRLRRLLDESTLGAAPPRATRAALYGFPGVGAYRNGWLVMTPGGTVFLFGGLLGARRVNLPDPVRMESGAGLWVNSVRVHLEDGGFTLYLLKDGPPVDQIVHEYQLVTP
jgi:hypothetical protein